MAFAEAAESLLELAVRHAGFLKGLALGSAAFFIVTPAAAPVLIILMPEDALVRRRTGAKRRPPLRQAAFILWHTAKNLFGGVLMVLGFVLLFLPGQGLLTLFAGVLLADIPGRRALAARLLGTGKIRPAVDRLRARYGRKALIYPDEVFAERKGEEAGREG